MCRHYSLKEETLKSLPINREEKEFPSREIEVSNLAPVFLLKEGRIVCKMIRFGFRIGSSFVYNARIETASQKDMFQPLYHSSRCLIPCSGFYESDKYHKEHYFEDVDQNSFYLLGLYREDSFVILTEKGNEEVSFYHPRMPVAVHKKEALDFLKGKEIPPEGRISLHCFDTSELISLF